MISIAAPHPVRDRETSCFVMRHGGVQRRAIEHDKPAFITADSQAIQAFAS
jgi:hypothetical protein